MPVRSLNPGSRLKAKCIIQNSDTRHWEKSSQCDSVKLGILPDAIVEVHDVDTVASKHSARVVIPGTVPTKYLVISDQELDKFFTVL